MTLVLFGSVKLAVAVEFASVPASGALFTVTGAATPSVFTVTAMIVPSGTLEASRFTLTGFETVGLNVMSGGSRKVPWDGTGEATLAMEAILTLGEPAGRKTGPGVPEEGGGVLIVPVRPKLKASSLIRPKPNVLPLVAEMLPLPEIALATRRIPPPEPALPPSVTSC
jgi:hypothetical protein